MAYAAINVKAFGAVGDGVTDDTAAFQAARDAWKASIRTNLAPNSDGNRIGTFPIEVPPGSYLITQAQAMLDSGFTTRTSGMEWRGTAGGGQCQILYQPVSPGPLFYNNDAILGLRLTNLWFNANDTGSDFMLSNSTGGAQNYISYDCRWNGIWGYGFHLTGTNVNSEFGWYKCAVSGTYTAFLFPETSDQFLNYWFDMCSINSITGKFISAPKGGNIKIHKSDFSGYSAGQIVTLFDLQTSSHALGVCSFECISTRFEIGANTTVMSCAWGFGQVRFAGCDMSSQAAQAWSATCIPFSFSAGNSSGPNIDFDSCLLMGLHAYISSSSVWMTKKSVAYTKCDTGSFVDFYAMFSCSITGGSINAYPPIAVDPRCRGSQSTSLLDNTLTARSTAWGATTAYVVDDIRVGGSPSAGVFNDWWVYKCTVPGTSGTVAPFGPGTVVDGTVTWLAIGGIFTADMITAGSVNFGLSVQKMAGMEKTADLQFGNGGLGARASSTVKGYGKILLPPNSIVTRVEFYYPNGSSNQSGTGSWRVFADGVAGISQTFLDFTISTPSNGFTEVWTGAYNCGATNQERTIVLEAGLDVTTKVIKPAYCKVTYLCGE